MSALFDRYADRFDEDLAALVSRSPGCCLPQVSEGIPPRSLDIADLGCGTGLCGVEFRPLARTLTGVDISQGMLGRAANAELCDSLIQGEITEFLHTRRASFNLLISADVFIYVGDLEAIFEGARTALRPGGQFAFSVETHEGAGFALRPSRRYAHALSYLRECAVRHHFVENKAQPIALRHEFGRVIAGMIVVLSRASVSCRAQPRPRAASIRFAAFSRKSSSARTVATSPNRSAREVSMRRRIDCRTRHRMRV